VKVSAFGSKYFTYVGRTRPPHLVSTVDLHRKKIGAITKKIPNETAGREQQT